ncbi:hypothetical protein [Enterococcus sp. AZ109]|uniref:hypothetical protein n=1 Tax=Enterococcus sp. AZ109 TaxID=2774634 RepID=UPI003F285C98
MEKNRVRSYQRIKKMMNQYFHIDEVTDRDNCPILFTSWLQNPRLSNGKLMVSARFYQDEIRFTADYISNGIKLPDDMHNYHFDLSDHVKINRLKNSCSEKYILGYHQMFSGLMVYRDYSYDSIFGDDFGQEYETAIENLILKELTDLIENGIQVFNEANRILDLCNVR